MTYIKRADAIEAVANFIWHLPNEIYSNFNSFDFAEDIAKDALRALPSADAVPTVIRSRTLMPTKDFKEWAKRIRETNPNAVIIPCDAEVVSADAVQGEWIPCSEKLPSEDGCYLVCMSWKYDNMEVLRWADGWNCHRDYDGKISRESEIDGADITAWMPLPKPYKGGDYHD